MSRSKLSLSGLCGVALVSLVCVGGVPRISLAQDAQGTAADPPAQAVAAPARQSFDLSPRSAPERRIEAALDDPQGVDIEFIDQPLKEAMEYLNDAHGIRILLDERALQDEGIQNDEPLNHALSDITLRSALNIMLEPLGLTYIIQDEVLKITTRIVADERTETRVYDVRPLARVTGGSEQLAKTIRATISPGSWAAPLPDAKADSDPAQPPARRPGLPLDPARLLGALVATPPPPAQQPSAPDRTDTGLVALDGALVVTHNQDVHRRIAALLDQLEQLRERGDR